jgi:hypothetical protein
VHDEEPSTELLNHTHEGAVTVDTVDDTDAQEPRDVENKPDNAVRFDAKPPQP